MLFSMIQEKNTICICFHSRKKKDMHFFMIQYKKKTEYAFHLIQQNKKNAFALSYDTIKEQKEYAFHLIQQQKRNCMHLPLIQYKKENMYTFLHTKKVNKKTGTKKQQQEAMKSIVTVFSCSFPVLSTCRVYQYIVFQSFVTPH